MILLGEIILINLNTNPNLTSWPMLVNVEVSLLNLVSLFSIRSTFVSSSLLMLEYKKITLNSDHNYGVSE